MATRASWAKGRLTLEIETEKRPLPRQRRVWALPPFGSGNDPLITAIVQSSIGARWIGETEIVVMIPVLPVDTFGSTWILEHAYYTGALPSLITWERISDLWPLIASSAGLAPPNALVGNHLFRLVLISDDGKRRPYPYITAVVTAVYAAGVTAAPTGVTLAATNTRPA